MKNISLKSKTESPKTPGGISKSLLTPCRRVGLSRNWKKSGASPFNSPISGTPDVTKHDEKPDKKTRKRKESCEDTENLPNTEQDSKSEKTSDVNVTPVRNVEKPRRKKSKTLLSTLNNVKESNVCIDSNISNESNLSQEKNVKDPNISPNIEENLTESKDDISENVLETTPVKLTKRRSIKKSFVKDNEEYKNGQSNKNSDKIEVKESKTVNKEKSPNNLTKECIVVIQKKIFKNDVEENVDPVKSEKLPSQNMFDSDSDEKPLSKINETSKIKDDDDDFELTKTKKSKPKKEQISIPKKTNSKITEKKKTHPEVQTICLSSDEDDDFMDKKRTIIIKKTYDKPTKPLRAKSTGSITQKDIDDLKLRIKAKKNQLLAKSMSEDTQELRDLIKKWQKGCQDALIQLMELMKRKMPDQNLSYTEMLKSLKIPAILVGYDSDNDNFTTPEDNTIILANLND